MGSSITSQVYLVVVGVQRRLGEQHGHLEVLARGDLALDLHRVHAQLQPPAYQELLLANSP